MDRCWKARCGSELPLRQELCRESSISRSTARRAYSALEQEGLVSGSKGSKRVVSAPMSFHDDGNRLNSLEVYGERPHLRKPVGNRRKGRHRNADGEPIRTSQGVPAGRSNDRHAGRPGPCLSDVAPPLRLGHLELGIAGGLIDADEDPASRLSVKSLRDRISPPGQVGARGNV
ncbi:GntR family transcriptional regulator [Streptomyces thioluteus]|uniref:GntR family transcriptional regulator n=1 Tax=Streptomyces thioluteus TaxID=66431 RepID=UPI003CD086B0